MRLLLDTHAYLWWLADDSRLRSHWRDAIGSPASTVLVSAASIWEMAIKAALGKLDSGGVDLADEIEECGFRELPISAAHASAAGALPRLHEDPFDRMLIAQAGLEGLTLVTRDRAFQGYAVSVLGA